MGDSLLESRLSLRPRGCSTGHREPNHAVRRLAPRRFFARRSAGQTQRRFV